MESWSSRPDRQHLDTALPLIRVKPGRAHEAIIISDDIVGAHTHFWRNRTALHTPENCDACAAGRAPRWYGYLACWQPATKIMHLLELTPPATPPLDGYYTMHGTLRGALLRLGRLNQKPNSKLIASVEESAYQMSALPSSPNVQAHLCRMWEIDLDTMLGFNGCKVDRSLTNGQAHKSFGG